MCVYIARYANERHFIYRDALLTFYPPPPDATLRPFPFPARARARALFDRREREREAELMEKCGVHNSIIDCTHVGVYASGVFTHPRRRCRCVASVTGKAGRREGETRIL